MIFCFNMKMKMTISEYLNATLISELFSFGWSIMMLNFTKIISFILTVSSISHLESIRPNMCYYFSKIWLCFLLPNKLSHLSCHFYLIFYKQCFFMNFFVNWASNVVWVLLNTYNHYTETHFIFSILGSMVWSIFHF